MHNAATHAEEIDRHGANGMFHLAEDYFKSAIFIGDAVAKKDLKLKFIGL
jgi:hypothetical protein